MWIIRVQLEPKSHALPDLRHQPTRLRSETPEEKRCPDAGWRAVAVPARRNSRVAQESSSPASTPFPAALVLSSLLQPHGCRCQTRCHLHRSARLDTPHNKFVTLHYLLLQWI